LLTVDRAAELSEVVGTLTFVTDKRAHPSVGSMTDVELRSSLVELEQSVRKTQARQADVMNEMRRRALDVDAAMADETGHGACGVEQFVVDEIAVLLHCTKAWAARRYATAGYAARHQLLAQAWGRGDVDERTVALIAESVQCMAATSDPVAVDKLINDAVSYAKDHTSSQLGAWFRRRVTEADPSAAQRRVELAAASRRVIVTPEADGVSTLWALLPSINALRIWRAVDQAAHTIDDDDDRTMDQRRADALVDLILGRATHTTDVQVVVSAETLEGRANDPGYVPGVGAITAETARDLAGLAPSGGGAQGSAQSISGCALGDDVAWRRLLTDPATGVLTDMGERRYRPSVQLDRAVRARDVYCRFPGCRRQATKADLDHTKPWPAGETTAANLAALCRHHHRLKHRAGWEVTLEPDGTMTWRSPVGSKYVTHPWRYGYVSGANDPVG
jgi:hypothetical protein